jgi:hypothetical protein
MGDANGQIASNPRIARLIFLANQRNCHNY